MPGLVLAYSLQIQFSYFAKLFSGWEFFDVIARRVEVGVGFHQVAYDARELATIKKPLGYAQRLVKVSYNAIASEVGLVDFFQFDNESQVRFRRNARSAVCAVSEIPRNVEFDHSALVDQLQAFRPAWNDTVQRKRSRRTATIGTVELFAIGRIVSAREPALVVNRYFVRRGRRFSVALAANSVLEA